MYVFLYFCISSCRFLNILEKAMRVDPLDFQWLERPDRSALEAATEELSLLGALDHRGNLTPLGHLIGDLQIDPGIAHMIYYACFKGLGILGGYITYRIKWVVNLHFFYRKNCY